MRILLFEDNLMWSSRLIQSLKALGHEPIPIKGLPTDETKAEAAIINLGQASPAPADLVQALKRLEIPIVAHAGHKEKELLGIGRDLGVDLLTTNSELTFKLEDILQRVAGGS